LFLSEANLILLAAFYSKTGCSVVRLARHVRDVEVGSSNLPTPTGVDIGSVAQLDRATDF
jgi:hypothetical protein